MKKTRSRKSRDTVPLKPNLIWFDDTFKSQSVKCRKQWEVALQNQNRITAEQAQQIQALQQVSQFNIHE
jgi:hypothetical protein